MPLLLILFLFLVGCSSKPEISHFSGTAMTIPYHIIVGASPKEKEKITTIIATVFNNTDRIYNNWNPHSEISHLNACPAETKIVLSPELKALLEIAKRVAKISEGRFDPSVAPLAHAWKEALKKGHLPENSDAPVGISKFHLEGEECWKEEAGCALDFGGIAKGHAVDLLTEALNDAGYSNIYVEWGGEIRTTGLHPEGRKWTIGIKGITTITLSNQAIATSGNYEQAWEVGGVSYTHIIDPRTKTPLVVKPGAIASATVIAPTCAYADAVATALMLFDTSEEALAWARTLNDVTCWIAES